MNIQQAETYWVEICIAGNYEDALRICKEYCNEEGLCVTVTKTEFVYTRGIESGVIVRLVNYPRFPVEYVQQLDEVAYNLTLNLIAGLYQGSAFIQNPNMGKWITTEDYVAKT